MPYSITTKDGITIDNIPDSVPADAPELKERVAKIRTGGTSKPASDIQAPASGIAMGLRDSVDAGAQLLRRAVPEDLGKAVDTFGNWLADKGLPVAKSEGVEGVDRIVNEVNKGYEQNRKATAGGEDPGFDGKRLFGNLINPVNYMGPGAAAGANTVKNLAIAGAKAGALSGALQPVVGDENQNDFWTNKAGQATAGAAAGAVLTPAITKGAEKAASVVKSSMPRRAPQPQNIEIAVNNTFATQGMNPREVPEVIMQSVQRQVREAMDAGQRLDPAAMVRRAQFEAVGMTGDAAPTAGQLTRDPMQFANEKNLSGVRLKTPQGEGNPLADRFQAQNNRLHEVFDRVGANEAVDRVSAGQMLIDPLKKYDQQLEGGVRAGYQAFRDATGADLPVPLDAIKRGYKQTVSDFEDVIPSAVRNKFDEIVSGPKPPHAHGHGAQAVPKPPTTIVDEAGNVLLDLAQLQQKKLSIDDAEKLIKSINLHYDPKNKAQALALDKLRKSVQESIIGATESGEGMEAATLANLARSKARERFQLHDNTPALRAAVNGEAPDDFVRRYVLNADVRDIKALSDALANRPEALAQARAQVAEHLKNAAFGVNVSGDKAFSADRYMQTLRAIGPEKLKLFFSPAELVQLNLAGKVASDINSIPAGARYATNTSGTGSAVMNLLSKISEAPMLRQLPFGRALANQVGEIRTEQAITRALNPVTPQPARELSPEAVRALQFFFTPAGVAGGVLGGSAVNQ